MSDLIKKARRELAEASLAAIKARKAFNETEQALIAVRFADMVIEYEKMGVKIMTAEIINSDHDTYMNTLLDFYLVGYYMFPQIAAANTQRKDQLN